MALGHIQLDAVKDVFRLCFSVSSLGSTHGLNANRVTLSPLKGWFRQDQCSASHPTFQ